MKRLICIFILLFLIYIFTIPKNEEKSNNEEILLGNDFENSSISLNMEYESKVKTIDLEDYIIGVVSCEMPASFEIEALKAQSVASRTFILEKVFNDPQYIINDTNGGQCYSSISEMQEKWGKNYNQYYNKIKEAVFNTKGEYLTYQNKIIKSYYFSTSNGYTENVINVFGEKLDYLVSVESSWDKEATNYEKRLVFEEKDFMSKLDISSTLDQVYVEERNESQRVQYVIVNDKKIKGTTFRKLLNLRSTDFDIEYEDNQIAIITRGYGHGVGLSQYGSNGMAQEGYKYKEILQYYYKNTEIKNV